MYRILTRFFSTSSKVEFSRLPKNVIPINYALSIKPDLNKFKFDGRVAIDVEVTIIDLILIILF